MMDDQYQSLRAFNASTSQKHRGGNESASLIHPVVVGQVFANPVVPASTAAYFSVHPVSTSGVEGEANPGILTVDASRSFLVYVVGSKRPVSGENLICRFVGNRWVAERMGRASTGISLPGCPCTVPPLLHMSVIRPDANSGMFQDATLAYGPTPQEFASLALGTNSYISTTDFLDIITNDRFRFHFFCAGGYFCINRIYATSVYGTPFSDAIRYRWLGGLPGNTCTPFIMTNGRVYPGGDPTSVVSLSE